MKPTAERLLALAESYIRDAGYRGFSFRDLAAQVGIKSASVHHHFPTKAGMIAAVTRRYGSRFLEVVKAKQGETPDEAIATYRAAFREALRQDGKMCLAGVLGAEAGALPTEVVEEVRNFFGMCVQDLAERLGGEKDAELRGFQVMATLEGAMILARVHGDITVFDQATEGLVAK